jgi:hypothetical protein
MGNGFIRVHTELLRKMFLLPDSYEISAATVHENKTIIISVSSPDIPEHGEMTMVEIMPRVAYVAGVGPVLDELVFCPQPLQRD